MSNRTYLDAEELLQLAIHASQKDDHETAIINLKRALEISPENAKLHYFLGAEHAQIGLFDRAMREMTHAIQLDSSLVAAIFQLGLIHLTSGQVEQAIECWLPLNELGESNYLYLFKTGMIHLSRDEFDECESHLKKGIDLNQENKPLNQDMQRILADIENRRKEGLVPSTDTTQATAENNHFFLSAYADSNQQH